MKQRLFCFLLCSLLLFPSCCLFQQDSKGMSEKVNYWIAKIDEEPLRPGSVPVNQKAYDNLVGLGKPAVLFIVNAIEEGKVSNLNIYLVLQDITGVQVEHGLKSEEGTKRYLKKIKQWLYENNLINTDKLLPLAVFSYCVVVDMKDMNGVAV